MIGLYSVPGQDAAKALISTVSGLAALGGAAVGQAAQVAGLVKEGVDNILGLDETKLQLGVRDSFYPKGNPLRSGHYIGIAAETSDIDASALWVRGGRLVKGVDPIASKPYEDHDYMVIAVERVGRRDDLLLAVPELAEFDEKFGRIMADPESDAAVKGRRLNELWPAFQQALANSRSLTRPDRERVAGSVQEDLKLRLRAIKAGGPFETRSWGDATARSHEPTEFALMDVPDYIDPADPESAPVGKAALQGTPSF